jgi:histidinol phosphatase-like enzyme (inositol monophosphatase family)
MTIPAPLDLEPLAELAGRLATAAGAAAVRHFRTPVTAEAKADQSPVSIADREAEAAMRAILLRDRPQDGVHGEEHGITEGSSGLTWVLDPIDGTKAFLTGRPTFVTLIALLDRGKPVLGLIDQPVLNDRWIGVTGRPTTYNGQPVSTRGCAKLSDAVFSSTMPGAFEGTPREDGYRRLAGACRYATWGGDGFSVGLLASGFIDLVLESGMQLYDFAPFAPIVEGAGGRVTDWDGNALSDRSDGSALVVGDTRLLDRALGQLHDR